MTEAQSVYCIEHKVTPDEIAALRGPNGMYGSYTDGDLDLAKALYENEYGVAPTECWWCEGGAFWFQVPVDTVK